MMYPLVRELAVDGIPVTVTCRVLKIARQPYYRWLAAPVTTSDVVAAYRANALFDAHRDDPLASCLVETDAYGDMTAAMRDLGAELESPVLVCLEGGYSPSALADSVVATLGALNNGTAPRPARAEAAEPHLSRLRERWRL